MKERPWRANESELPAKMKLCSPNTVFLHKIGDNLFLSLRVENGTFHIHFHSKSTTKKRKFKERDLVKLYTSCNYTFSEKKQKQKEKQTARKDKATTPILSAVFFFFLDAVMQNQPFSFHRIPIYYQYCKQNLTNRVEVLKTKPLYWSGTSDQLKIDPIKPVKRKTLPPSNTPWS